MKTARRSLPPTPSPQSVLPSWAWLLVQSSLDRTRIALDWLRDPAAPLLLRSAMRSSEIGHRQVSDAYSPASLSSSFAALQGLTRTPLVGVSRLRRLQGFLAPWHDRSARSGSHGLCLPATFRPQGLVTLSTVYSLAGPAGIESRQRPGSSPFAASPGLEVVRRSRRTRPAYRCPQISLR